MEENIPTTNNSKAAKRKSTEALESMESKAAKRMSTETSKFLQGVEMLMALTVSSPPEHAADDSRSPSKYQKLRAAALCCLLTQYNIAVKRRDRKISDGTYDPNTEENKIVADKIKTAIEVTRKLYQQFVAASKRDNTEQIDSKLMESIMASGITSDDDVIYDGRRVNVD